jgi:hypothetical protein
VVNKTKRIRIVGEPKACYMQFHVSDGAGKFDVSVVTKILVLKKEEVVAVVESKRLYKFREPSHTNRMKIWSNNCLRRKEFLGQNPF